MVITRVQGSASGSAVRYITVTMASPPTSGNVLVAVIGSFGQFSAANVSSIIQTGATWSGGGTGKQIQKKGISPNWEDLEIWFGTVGANASASILVSLSTTTYGGMVDVCEYSGVLTSNFLDQTAINSSSAGSKYPDTGTTATTTQASELWIGGTTAFVNQTTPTNDFTLLDGMDVYGSIAYLEKIVSSTGTANSGTTTATSTPWVGCIATFSGSAAAGAAAKKYFGDGLYWGVQ